MLCRNSKDKDGNRATLNSKGTCLGSDKPAPGSIKCGSFLDAADRGCMDFDERASKYLKEDCYIPTYASVLGLIFGGVVVQWFENVLGDLTTCGGKCKPSLEWKDDEGQKWVKSKIIQPLTICHKSKGKRCDGINGSNNFKSLPRMSFRSYRASALSEQNARLDCVKNIGLSTYIFHDPSLTHKVAVSNIFVYEKPNNKKFHFWCRLNWLKTTDSGNTNVLTINEEVGDYYSDKLKNRGQVQKALDNAVINQLKALGEDTDNIYKLKKYGLWDNISNTETDFTESAYNRFYDIYNGKYSSYTDKNKRFNIDGVPLYYKFRDLINQSEEDDIDIIEINNEKLGIYEKSKVVKDINDDKDNNEDKTLIPTEISEDKTLIDTEIYEDLNPFKSNNKETGIDENEKAKELHPEYLSGIWIKINVENAELINKIKEINEIKEPRIYPMLPYEYLLQPDDIYTNVEEINRNFNNGNYFKNYKEKIIK